MNRNFWTVRACHSGFVSYSHDITSRHWGGPARWFILIRTFVSSRLLLSTYFWYFAYKSKEQSIVDHRHSCYVLSRSGRVLLRGDLTEIYADSMQCRKTTTMLFKMLGIERAYNMFSEDLAHPRHSISSPCRKGWRTFLQIPGIAECRVIWTPEYFPEHQESRCRRWFSHW